MVTVGVKGLRSNSDLLVAE